MTKGVTYNRKQVAGILERIADGEALMDICKEPGMPHESSIRRWALEDRDGVRERFRIAMELRAHHWAEGVLSIADDGRNDWMESNDPENPGWKFNGEHFQRSRLRVDTRKWLAAKFLPRVYGDRYTVEGDPNAPLMSSTTNIIDFSGLSRDERAALKAILVRRLAGPAGGDEGADEG